MVFEGLFSRTRNADRAAEATTQAPPAMTRPSIGLALGGGAARGFAHIGVMRTLAKHGIVPDVIVGTSIGAVVGGCYAAKQLDTLEDWSRTLSVRSVLGYLDISLSGSGLISGNHLASKLEAGLQDTRIDDLPLRYAAIATEFNTGHEIWLTRGRLADAMRASYALPGIFPPVLIGGRWLVDGALVNPVPVSVCRAHEQPLVVAVNLHYDLYGRAAVIKHNAGDLVVEKDADPRKAPSADTREARLGITGVMVEAFNIIQDRISRARLAGDPPDMSLQPKLGHIGLSEFHRAEEAIELGYEAARAHLPELKRLQTVLA